MKRSMDRYPSQPEQVGRLPGTYSPPPSHSSRSAQLANVERFRSAHERVTDWRHAAHVLGTHPPLPAGDHEAV